MMTAFSCKKDEHMLSDNASKLQVGVSKMSTWAMVADRVIANERGEQMPPDLTSGDIKEEAAHPGAGSVIGTKNNIRCGDGSAQMSSLGHKHLQSWKGHHILKKSIILP